MHTDLLITDILVYYPQKYKNKSKKQAPYLGFKAIDLICWSHKSRLD